MYHRIYRLEYHQFPRVIYHHSPFLSNLIRASSVARTPSATLFPVTCLVLGGSSPSLIPATGFAFASGLANPPAFTPKKNRIALAHMRFFHYLCGAIYSIIIYYENNHHLPFGITHYHAICQRLSSIWSARGTGNNRHFAQRL